MFGAFQLGSAIAAPTMGYYHDKHGNYIGALWGITALVLLGAVLIALLSPYPDQAEAAQALLAIGGVPWFQRHSP